MSMQSLIDSRPLHHRVYDVLIDRVITGNWSRVTGSTQPTRPALGVSRTPVKEALNRLASEGIVDIQARRGTSVKVPTQTEVSELYEIMRMIGLYVAEPAIRRATPDDILALRELLAAIEVEITDGVITDYAAYLKRTEPFTPAWCNWRGIAGSSRCTASPACRSDWRTPRRRIAIMMSRSPRHSTEQLSEPLRSGQSKDSIKPWLSTTRRQRCSVRRRAPSRTNEFVNLTPPAPLVLPWPAGRSSA